MTDWHGAFQGKLQPGTSPGLLLVDPVNAYLEPSSPLFLESGAAALANMAVLAEEFHGRDLPVIFTGVRYEPGGANGGLFFKKVPALEVFEEENPLGAFPESLSPQAKDPIFIKQYPSAFFRTSLEMWLREREIDTLFIAGFSTSGCVRASALDALQNGFVPVTVADACADRDDTTHASNLSDLGKKYSEIAMSETIPRMLNAIIGE